MFPLACLFEPAFVMIFFHDTSVKIPILENSSLWTRKSYVVIDGISKNDKNIDDPSS